MKPIPKSGFNNTNNFGRIALLSYEDVLGKSGLNALLRLAGLANLIDNYPPANTEKGFDFSDYTAILMALEEIYGARGGRGLALRAGRATFNDLLASYGAMAGVGDLAFRVLPLVFKVRIGLTAAAKVFSSVSDQQTAVLESEDAFIWTITRCPSCWGRSGSDKPVCHVTVGFLQAALRWVSNGHDFRISESRCCAMGEAVCEFIIHKDPIS
jgi:predicted hydrocarbon binding protein